MRGSAGKVRARARVLIGVIVVGTLFAVAHSASAATPPPPLGGYFKLSTPGTPFPSDADCASRVHRSSWEPRAVNASANHTVPPQPVKLADSDSFVSRWNTNYKSRITGNFVGTTDEIIQWAACKWGWSDDAVRAEMVDESDWYQSELGDYEARSRGHCTPDFTADPCPTSFGALQIKWYYHPIANLNGGSSYPYAHTATAFNLDYTLAELRGCYDGLSSYLGNTRGDMWGCIGQWYSGAWRDSGALSYISRVQNYLNAAAWRTWSDQGSTTPPTAATTTTTVAKPTTTTTAPPRTTTTTVAPKSTTTTTVARCSGLQGMKLRICRYLATLPANSPIRDAWRLIAARWWHWRR